MIKFWKSSSNTFKVYTDEISEKPFVKVFIENSHEVFLADISFTTDCKIGYY